MRLQTNTTDLIGEKVSVFDMVGKQLQTFKLQSTTQDIDLSSLPAGVYLVKIKEQAVRVVKN